VIIGAGPFPFYAADQLLGAGFAVDRLDALPTPFGLVRAGSSEDQGRHARVGEARGGFLNMVATEPTRL
jgi:hypothetical protein